MKDLFKFSASVQTALEADQSKFDAIRGLMFEASNNSYVTYTKDETNNTIKGMFNAISGFDWTTATAKERRQDWRAHKADYFTIIEDIIEDRLVSGWSTNPFFEQFCDVRNLSLGDKNLFTVAENSLMTVAKFSGNHHDVIRQKVGFGKSFSVETSNYYIACYNDYELFRTGRIDFTKMIDKMYASIEKYRTDAAYVQFMSADTSLPTDLVVDTALTVATKDVVIELAEEIKAVTGYDVMFVGTKVALGKLNATIAYDIWSESMKQELHMTGEIGNYEGYRTLTIPRVNEFNSRVEKTDNTKIMIVPISNEFKPIKIVNEGDVTFFESGMNGEKKDMTIEAELSYKEGISVVINMLYGIINIE